jgi:hypothetical protein
LEGSLNGQPATGSVRPAGELSWPTAGAGHRSWQEQAQEIADSLEVTTPDLRNPAAFVVKPGAEAVGTGAQAVNRRMSPADLDKASSATESGQQPAAVEDFDAAFDAALDDAFGKPGGLNFSAC